MSRQLMWQKLLRDERERCDILFAGSDKFTDEGHNRTKALMRQGYGYRNRQHLRLRILLGDLV